MPRRSYLTTGVLLATVVISGCAPTPLQILPFRQAPDAARCGPLVSALPATVGGQPRRATTGAEDSRAWGRAEGTNPIVAKCGVPQPDAFQPTSQCLTINGVDWFVSATGDATAPTVVTTVYRSPALELSIPRVYGTQAEMIDVTPAVLARTTITGHCK